MSTKQKKSWNVFKFPGIQYLFGASLDFNSVLFIKKCAEDLELWFSWSEKTSQPKTHIFGERVCHRIVKQINNFAFRHEVCPLNLFFYKISWVGVEHTKNIQRIWQNTKHKCVYQIKKLVQYSSCLLVFYEHIHLDPNKPFRQNLYVNCRCKETSRFSEVKKSMINDWENTFSYWEESEWSEALAYTFQQWWNLAAV